MANRDRIALKYLKHSNLQRPAKQNFDVLPAPKLEVPPKLCSAAVRVPSPRPLGHLVAKVLAKRRELAPA